MLKSSCRKVHHRELCDVCEEVAYQEYLRIDREGKPSSAKIPAADWLLWRLGWVS